MDDADVFKYGYLMGWRERVIEEIAWHIADGLTVARIAERQLAAGTKRPGPTYWKHIRATRQHQTVFLWMMAERLELVSEVRDRVDVLLSSASEAKEA